MKKILIRILYKFRLLAITYYVNNSYKSYLFNKNFAKSQANWRFYNQHNYTQIANTLNEMQFPIDKVTVGKHTYGPLCVHHFGTIDEKLKIGNYCSISIGVRFILGGNHSTNTFSTYPFHFIFNNNQCEAWTKGPIIVEDDVWIGTDAIILSGITLGKGTIVAAGSVVTKSTAPYSLVGGNPAKLIKMRFNEDIINMLMDIEIEKLDENRILTLLPKLYSPLSVGILVEIKNELIKL